MPHPDQPSQTATVKSKAAPGSNARSVALAHIVQRLQQYPDLHPQKLETTGLNPKEAGLARALDAVVVRYWSPLVHVISQHLSRPWERLDIRVQGILLLGAGQLLYLDRIPPHAAIYESVELTRRGKTAKAASLVNAVLRKVEALRVELIEDPDINSSCHLPRGDGKAWLLGRAIFDEDPIKRLAQQTSHSEELVRNWHALYGPDQTRILCLHGLVESPTILTGFHDRPEDMMAHDIPGFALVGNQHDKISKLLSKHAHWRIQDPGSATTVMQTEQLQPKLIFDACAGRGTKTRQLALTHPDARIISSDIASHRLSQLRKSVAHLPSVEVIDYQDRFELAGKVDLLMLDVPCSNTGTLARRLEARHRYNSTHLKELVALQRQIVADTFALLHPSGKLLYATCSLCTEENEEQVDWICRQHRMRIAQQKLHLPKGVPGDPITLYQDGAFAALLTFQGS
mgnify:CR=1 FL=1